MYDYSYQWAGLDHNTQCVAYGRVTLSTLPVPDQERNESGLCPNKIKRGWVCAGGGRCRHKFINNLGECVFALRTCKHFHS